MTGSARPPADGLPVIRQGYSPAGYESGTLTGDDVPPHDRERMHFGEIEASLISLAAGIGSELPVGTTVLDAISWIEAAITRLEGGYTPVYGLSLRAIIYLQGTASFTLSARVLRPGTGSWMFDAVIRASQTSSMTLGAIVQGSQTGSLALDAVIV